MEHFQLQTTRQFEDDSNKLNKTIEEKTQENRILSKQMEFLMIQRESLQSRLITAHHFIRQVREVESFDLRFRF
jgi:hypothetical protein